MASAGAVDPIDPIDLAILLALSSSLTISFFFLFLQPLYDATGSAFVKHFGFSYGTLTLYKGNKCANRWSRVDIAQSSSKKTHLSLVPPPFEFHPMSVPSEDILDKTVTTWDSYQMPPLVLSLVYVVLLLVVGAPARCLL
jgi:hypothetical protein